MNTKQKFDRIDQSKLNSIQVERLKTISEKTNNFKIEDKDLLEKIDTALDNIIAKLEENNPEALKPIAKRTYTKKGTTKGSASKSKTTRTKAKSVMGVAKNPTNNIMSVAKEIQKAGESWKDAMERAKQVLKERKEQGAQKVKTEMDKLLALVRTKKELQGFANSNLRRDSVRTAKPRGSRVVTKQGTTSNQYGTFDNKLGRKYWESRDRHADRLAPNYPKDMPYLEKGGMVLDTFKSSNNLANREVELRLVKGNNGFDVVRYHSNGEKTYVGSARDERTARNIFNQEIAYYNEKFSQGGSTEKYKVGQKFYDTRYDRTCEIVPSNYDGLVSWKKYNKSGTDFENDTINSLVENQFDYLVNMGAYQISKQSMANGGDLDEVAEIYISGYPYYIKKMGDSTHFKLANSKEGVEVVSGSHIGQHRDEEYYEDVRSWLKGGKSPNGNKYDSKYYADGGFMNNVYAKGGAIDKYDVDRFKQVMNGKAIARYVVRLTDVFGNKETYVFGIKLKDKFKGCELQPYEVLYGSWTDSGTPFSLSNLQVQKLVPNTYTNIELDEAETTDLVSKIIKNDKAGVEKFLNTSFFFIDSGKGAKKKFEDILKMHFGKSVGYFSSSEFKIPENFANGGMTDLTMQNVSFKNGGNVTNEEKLIKELHRLQRDLNSSRLSRYREGDDSEEQKEKNRERESKLARFNEVLKTLRESDGKMANGGSLPYMTDPNFGDFQNTGSFELGGAFMTTDLAGHSGGGTGGLNADMPLSGVTGTNYTGLVGETGAMSSGELFENGGGIEKTTKVEDIKNAMYKAFQSYLDGKTSDEKLVSALNRILGKRKWFRFFQGDTMASTPRTVESALDSRMNRESVKEDMQIALDTKGLQIYNWEGDEIFEAGGGIEKKVYSIEKGNEPYDFKLYTYKEAQLKANEYMKEDPSSLYQPRLYNDMRSELPAIERMNMPKLDKNGKLYDVNNTPFSKGDLANYELGGAMMQNQQVINDASQPYVITESFGNPAQQLGMLAKGGAIENQYKGRTPEDVWNNLTQQQRGHFLIDHKNKIIANISIDPQVIEDFEKEGGLSKNLLGLIKRSEKLNYSKLNKYVKQVFEEHIENGEYAKGGSIPNNYEGRTPEDIWNNLSKPQRSHFLYDHVSEIEAYKNIDRLPSREIIKAYNSDWETLDKDIKNRFANHTREGQYANGGSVNKYFDDMTEAEILEKTVVYDNAESLDRYTVFTPDGSVFAMSETASGFNQYVGEDSEIKKGKHLGKRLKSVPKEIEWAVLDRMKEDEEYASGGSLGKALYVEWSSWFDSNKYDEEKIMSVLEKIGAKKIHLENDRGWSNQPEVVVFNGDKNKAQDALNEAFDTVWIRVSEKDWRNRKMADGGSVGDVSGNYYSTTDFVSQNDIMDLAKSTFGQDWESGGDYDYDTEEIKMLVKKLGGGYKIVYVDSEQREKFENAKSKYLHLLKNKSNDGDIFVIPNKKMAEGGEISIYNLRKGDKVKTRKGDIETIIKRTGSGSYETIENDYTHSPESLEFVSRPSRKMAEGGFMNNVYAEGGKVKSRKQRNDELDALTEDEYKVWNKIGARSGGQIRGDENLLKNYAEGIEEVMQKKGIAKASFNKDDYDYLTDNNYHLLNEFLIFNGYYDSKVTNDLKGFMIADFYQEVAENGKSKYYPNPDVITVSSFADGGSLGYEVMIDGNYDEPKKFSTFSLAKKWIFKNIKNHDSLELVDSYGDSIFVEGDATKEDLDYLFSNQDASFKKGGAVSVKLEKGVYRLGKPTKVSTNLYEQKIVEIFDNGDISTASDYGRKLGDFKSQKYPIITKEVLDAQYKMAEGGGVRDYMDTPEYKEMVDRMQKLTYDVKGRVVRAIGLDRAIEFYDIDYPVRPYQLIEKAVRSGFITLDEINERVIDSALETAQDSEDDEEVGSSDFTAYLHSFLNDAGFKVGFVKNHLTREYANGGELINHTVEMSYSRPPKKGERTNWAYNEIVTYDVLAKNKSEAKKKALIKFSQMLPNEKPKIISIDDYKDTFPDNFILEEGGGVDDHWELRREGDGFGSILHNGKKVDDYEWDSDAMTFWVSNPMGGQKSIDTPTKLFNHYKAKGYADGGMFDDNDGFMKADNNFNYRYPQGDVHVDTIDESIDLTNNMPSRNNKVVVESLDEDINLNDDKRIRAKLSYEPKDRTPEKMMMVNQRMVIENLPKPTMNSHRNND